jgi:glycine dehydrogenase subunit 1
MSGFSPNPAPVRRAMLDALGIAAARDLFDAVPESVRLNRPLDLPHGKSEADTLAYLDGLAKRNAVFKTIFRGAGAYRHYIPSIVKRIAAKEEFVTAYTPYQAEISQGLLQCIFEYQTMICELTGMDVSNASVYDGAVAAAEAVAMCRGGKRQTAVVSEAVHPHVQETIRAYCAAAGTRVITVPHRDFATDCDALRGVVGDDAACVYVQQPNYFGTIEDARGIGSIAHGGGAKYIIGANPIALAVLESPGACGADIAVGEGQPLGLPLSFGGPYLGYMACRRELMRKLPGRIAGETLDRNGERAFVLTLQTREQHIKREKASSNICSNQAHCALTASAYMTVMGYAGMREAAFQCMAKAAYLHKRLMDIKGFEPVCQGGFFHEFVARCPESPGRLERLLEEHGILAGLPLSGGYEGHILWCATECNTKQEIDELAEILGGCAL